MSLHLKTVNLGIAKTGLSTVGYTIYDESGNVLTARSTSGVFEVGVTGIYGAKITFPDKEECILLWDSGEATPRYAMDESTIQLNIIQEETDRVRVIWNTLKNVGDTYAKLLNKLDKIKTFDNRKDFDDLTAEIKKIIIPKIPNIPTLDEIRSALKITVNPPEVKVPEVRMPDYTQKIEKIREMLISMGAVMYKIPLNEYSEKISTLATSLSKIQTVINAVYDNVSNSKNIDSLKSISGDLLFLIKELKGELKETRESLEAAIIENTKLDKTVKDLVTANGINKIIEAMSDSNRKKKIYA